MSFSDDMIYDLLKYELQKMKKEQGSLKSLFMNETSKIKSKEEIEKRIQEIKEIMNNFEHLYRTKQISKEYLEILTLRCKSELNALKWVLS